VEKMGRERGGVRKYENHRRRNDQRLRLGRDG
jgi:hypothetical protein